MGLRSTYKIEQGPKPPSIDKYASQCKNAWTRLLASHPEEKEVQSFLEKYPAFVPGAWTPGSKSGHYPLNCALISQPSLRGFPSKAPDFLWISKHSSMWYPTLIEIEKPDKKIFNSSGVPSQKFTQARNQLAQWRTWFSNPVNVQGFIQAYGIPNDILQSGQMKLHMILIYGRRSEFESKPYLARQRASLLSGSDEELMSFDRLSFDMDLEDAITVQLESNGRYRAISIPPTFKLGPNLAKRLCYIDRIDMAIENAIMISSERKAFLKSRIQYWREWAREENKGRIKSGDWE